MAVKSNSVDMTTKFHEKPYGRFIEIQSNLWRKKLHRTNQGSNFLGGSFSNRDNIRASIQFRREGQPQHLQRLFFLRNRPIHFHINSTSQTKSVKFFHHLNQQATSCTSLHCLVHHRFKFSQF